VRKAKPKRKLVRCIWYSEENILRGTNLNSESRENINVDDPQREEAGVRNRQKRIARQCPKINIEMKTAQKKK